MSKFLTDGSAVIVLQGEIDMAVVNAITEQVTAALDAEPTEVAVLMRDVTFIDSTGIGALVGARKACLAHDVPLVLEEPSPVVVRMLELTGLAAVMTTRP